MCVMCDELRKLGVHNSTIQRECSAKHHSQVQNQEIPVSATMTNALFADKTNGKPSSTAATTVHSDTTNYALPKAPTFLSVQGFIDLPTETRRTREMRFGEAILTRNGTTILRMGKNEYMHIGQLVTSFHHSADTLPYTEGALFPKGTKITFSSR